MLRLSAFLISLCFWKCLCSYPTYSEILGSMKFYVAAFNDLGLEALSSQMITVGKSTEGRDIIAFCFGNCRSGSSSLFIFGGIHGREGLSITAPMDFTGLILNKLQSHDKFVEGLLSQTMLWVIPSLNPDTYDSNVRQFKQRGRYGMHRKNSHKVCDGKKWRSEDGIDLNRNFPVCFDVDNQGSDGNPCSEIFRGFSPLSESETQSIPSFLKQLSVPPTVALSLHSYGRSVLHPFSCKSLGSTLNATSLSLFSHGIRSLLSGVPESYTTGQSWKIPGLYTVNGDAVDYLYHIHGILSFNVEFPPDYPTRDEYKAFWPDRETHRNETDRILWNALLLAGCNIQVINGNVGYHPCSHVRLQWGDKDVSLGTIHALNVVALPSELTTSPQSFYIEADESTCEMQWTDGSFRKVFMKLPPSTPPVMQEKKEESKDMLLVYPSNPIFPIHRLWILAVLQAFFIMVCFGVMCCYSYFYNK